MVPLQRLESSPELETLVMARFGRPLAGFPHDQGTAMIKDEMRCIRCGLCAKRCPTDAITMEALSFVEEYVGGTDLGEASTFSSTDPLS
jgi:NAD-dependent dihydropyrimidine dehydrogenase PreA subunit